MAADAMVFAMANPTPEVTPEEAEPYARIIATGRSDYPNQINNVLCFPGIFRGALDVRAREITEDMKMAAARGIAAVVPDERAERGPHHPLAVQPRRAQGRRRRRRRAGHARGPADADPGPRLRARATRRSSARSARSARRPRRTPS